jgi:Lon protease-like protein
MSREKALEKLKAFPTFQEGILALRTKDFDEKTERIRELENELALLQRWPDLDWAQAKKEFLQHLAYLARSGEQPAAKAALETLDKLQTYVNRVLAERDKLKARLDASEG